MKWFKYCVLLLLPFLISCQTLPFFSQMPETPKQFKSRQILVTLAQKDKVRWKILELHLLRDYPLQKTGAFPLESLNIQCLIFQIPENVDADELIAKLERDERVETVQANKTFHSLSRKYSDQYAAQQVGVELTRAREAHSQFTGKGIKIAIIDTGIDSSHADLADQIKIKKSFVEHGNWNYTSDRHGTAVAGIIAAIPNNGIGIYGIAPDAELFGLKSCFYQKGKTAYAVCSSWSIAKALDYAIMESADIINFSLSGPQDQLLTRLINAAYEKNIILVAAINDRQHEVGFPAELSQVIGVLATEYPHISKLTQEKLQHKLVIAPGEDIVSTAPGGRYDFFSGSSLSTAIVSGTIALIKQKDKNLSPEQIYQSLINSEMVDACSALAISCN